MQLANFWIFVKNGGNWLVYGHLDVVVVFSCHFACLESECFCGEWFSNFEIFRKFGKVLKFRVFTRFVCLVISFWSFSTVFRILYFSSF